MRFCFVRWRCGDVESARKRYLVVEEREKLILERVSNGRYLLHADAAPASQICHAASRLSRAMSDAGIRPRLEVYDEGGNESVHYLEHRWPLTDG
jgi:hypothetical protein